MKTTAEDLLTAARLTINPDRVNKINAFAAKHAVILDDITLEICADENTGRRYGNAACRKGYASKIGGTTYQYQVWAVVKPEARK